MLKYLVALAVLCSVFIGPDLHAQQSGDISPPADQQESVQPDRGRRFRADDGRFRGRVMGMVPLLQVHSVKQELKLEGDQAAEVESFTLRVSEDFADEIRGVMESLRNASPEDREQLRAKMGEIGNRINERLTTVLSPEQISRLRQINLQLGLRRDGAMQALSSTDVSAALDLTPEQQEELREQARGARRQRGRDPKSLAEAREEANAVLTPEQQEKLANLLGDEFDLPAAMLQGGRGRGGFGGRTGGSEGRRPLRQRPESEQQAAPAEAI